MVRTLLKTSLREIRQSLGRYLAILAIVGLGVGFFAGLRASQPAMMATGVDYLDQQRFYDFRLLSTLGFTAEDVDAFAALEGVADARGAVYTDFLTEVEPGEASVLKAHSLTADINLPRLTAGRMPQAADECLADARCFSEADLGRSLPVLVDNDEDTRALLHCGAYTIVGLASSPCYLNYQRGTSSLGSGSVAGFVYIPEEGFDFDAYYEVFLTLENPGDAYSDGYKAEVDERTPSVEALTDQRAGLRYDTLYQDALAEIQDAEEEVADGWNTYHSERADADEELSDAYQELTDGERKYQEALADFQQGQQDYADGLQQYEEGVAELAGVRRELDSAAAELTNARRELDDAEEELASSKKELDQAQEPLNQAKAELDSAEAELAGVKAELDGARAELEVSKAQLDQTKEELDQGEAACTAGMAELTATAESQGISLEALLALSPEAAVAWEQLEAARTQLDQGRTQYEAGLAAYEEGYAQYQQGLAQYSSGWADYQQGLADYQQGLDAYQAGQRAYEEGYADYQQGLADYQQGYADYQQGLADYEAGQRELEDAWTELEDAGAELDRAPGELTDARRKLDEGWAEYNDGRAEADGEFADAERELQDAEAELQDARTSLANLKRASTYVLTREENTGYVCFENDTSIIAAISLVFPVFFFLVAALVCMTTMTRMVDEQRTQIGVLKALGYSNGQIMGKYLFYSGSAALIGTAAGYTLGSSGLPRIFWEIYGVIYGFAPLQQVVLPGLLTISFWAALLCSMGSTWLACRVELAKQAAELLRPKTPKAGRRVFLEYIKPLWRRLSFLHKVSVRNVLRYRSRLIMMVLGIGGCTALLCTGFGIQDSIQHVADNQYDEITLYDYAVSFQEDQSAEQAAAYLARKGWEEGLLVHSGSVDVAAGGESKSVYRVISSTGSLEGYVDLHSGEDSIPYPGPGEVVLNAGLAENLGIAPGDTVELRDGELGTIYATVSAIADNYVFNYAYIAEETYRQQLGQAPGYNALFLHSHSDADPYGEGSLLLDDGDVSSVNVVQASRDQVNHMLSRLDYVVVVVVLCAAALAFIVLYNLTNINITERVREIATIKVLGFYQNEVASYVFREIILLSVLGSLAGLLMGKALHAYVMAQIQIDSMFFACRIAPLSYVLSFCMTILFTFAISLGMRPRLRKIDMAESLKSIE